jgi:tetrahydromethanopterin S-methyltransferase subunit G
MDVEDRLEKIELKLDVIASAMANLARAEEKIISSNARLDALERKMEMGYNEHVKLLEAAKEQTSILQSLERIVKRLDHMEDNVNQLNIAVAKNDTITMDLKKIWGLIVAGAIGAVFYFWRS